MLWKLSRPTSWMMVSKLNYVMTLRICQFYNFAVLIRIREWNLWLYLLTSCISSCDHHQGKGGRSGAACGGSRYHHIRVDGLLPLLWVHAQYSHLCSGQMAGMYVFMFSSGKNGWVNMFGSEFLAVEWLLLLYRLDDLPSHTRESCLFFFSPSHPLTEARWTNFSRQGHPLCHCHRRQAVQGLQNPLWVVVTWPNLGLWIRDAQISQSPIIIGQCSVKICDQEIRINAW